VCHGAGETQQVQRSLLGQVITSRPCRVCRGFGEVIPDPCRQCNGDGRVRARRTVRANIPAGVGDGIRVRLAGQGEVGPGGGTPGDLYVEVRELPHDRFTRDGIDLHCTVHVPMTAAALGASMSLAVLDGEEDLDIQPGTQSGTVVTMRSQGMPQLRGTGRGNLYVHIEVVTPSRVDGRQAELLRELATLRGEEQPELAMRAHGGLFNRIRDSFSGR
jgi:molecular chaperone DnaJ